jgi:hypothetical protein
MLVLLGVIALFISPALDLEPSALRAARSAYLLFSALAALSTVLACMLRTLFWVESIRDSFSHPAPSLIDLNCARLR